MRLRVTTLRVREGLLSEVRRLSKELNLDKSDLLRDALSIGLRELRIRLALERYREGKASIGKAAEIAGVGYREIHDEMKKRGITLRYGKERFEEELKELKL